MNTSDSMTNRDAASMVLAAPAAGPLPAVWPRPSPEARRDRKGFLSSMPNGDPPDVMLWGGDDDT